MFLAINVDKSLPIVILFERIDSKLSYGTLFITIKEKQVENDIVFIYITIMV